MNTTSFEYAVSEAEDWITDMMAELGSRDRASAVACLRWGLRAVRDSVSAEEAAEIGGQLPLIVRGLFFEGWHPAEHRPMAFDELVKLIGRKCGGRHASQVTRAVVRVLERRLPLEHEEPEPPMLDSLLSDIAA
jgi:uncharacterized protein (DUF2267 family)